MFESELLGWLSTHLVRLGPGLLFLVCLLETAVFAGLILPVGALIAFSAMLSSRGVFDPAEVVAAAFFGALLGDQLGFVIGRWFAPAVRPPPRGDIARVWAAAIERTEKLVRTRGLFGISAARGIPFVRTMMPWFAGRTEIGWGKFLVFDFLGVLLWGTIYIGGGFLAGEGWRQIAGAWGETAGAVALALAVILLVLFSRGWLKRLYRRRAGTGSPPGP
ncbi:MAG: DedA family protein [Gemmatimonadota bacterium]